MPVSVWSFYKNPPLSSKSNSWILIYQCPQLGCTAIDETQCTMFQWTMIFKIVTCKTLYGPPGIQITSNSPSIHHNSNSHHLNDTKDSTMHIPTFQHGNLPGHSNSKQATNAHTREFVLLVPGDLAYAGQARFELILIPIRSSVDSGCNRERN